MPGEYVFPGHPTCEKPESSDIEHLESDIAATPALRVSQVSAASCYRAGVHEFLILELVNQIQEGIIWMRMERTPRRARGSAIFWTSRRWPAYDSYSISYNRDALLTSGGGEPTFVERLHNMSGAPSLYHVAYLMGIIRGVAPEWELRKTNCCWFCTVTLDSLNRHFGGERSTNSYRHFPGFDKVATKGVRERYHPQFLSEAFQGIRELSIAVVNSQSGNEVATRLTRLGSVKPLCEVTNMVSRTGSSMQLALPLSSLPGARDSVSVEQVPPPRIRQTTIFTQVSLTFGLSTASDPMDISVALTATLFRFMEINVRANHLGSEIVGLFLSHINPQDNELKQRLAPFSELTILWVTSNVVLAEDTEKRASLIRHYAELAHESCKQANYATALSIVTALSRLNIQELPETFRLVCGKTMEKIKRTRSESYSRASRAQAKSQAILPLKSSKTIAHFETLRHRLNSVPRGEGPIDNLFPEEIMRDHRRSGEQLEHNLAGCYLLLLTSMKHAAQNWDWEQYPTQMSRLRSEEIIEGNLRVDQTVF